MVDELHSVHTFGRERQSRDRVRKRTPCNRYRAIHEAPHATEMMRHTPMNCSNNMSVHDTTKGEHQWSMENYVPKAADKSDSKLEYYCPQRDTNNMNASSGYDAVNKMCSACHITTRDCASLVTCNSCEKMACHNCSSPSFFDCEYCDRRLCGDCVTNVPCEGPGCKCSLSNCMECAENGAGDVLYCTHCGRGFCNNFKSMEFCFCLEGDACPECHSEMHDYDVECYWRHLPPEMPQIISDFAVEINEDSLSDFWQECIQFLPPDEEFDKRLYRRTRRARAASLILASYHLLKGRDKEAVYLILYAALLEEAWNRGANYVTKFFDKGTKPSAKILAAYFTSFHSVIENTTTKANIIALLHNQLPSIREKEGRKLFECIDFALGNVEKSNTPIHSVPILQAEEYDRGSLSMNIITSTMDNETKQKNFVYHDMTLEWWLTIYVIKCSYHQWLSRSIGPSTKYSRVVHEGESIFLSTEGKKTLRQLGIKDGDEIVLEGIERDDYSTHTHESKTCESTCSACHITSPMYDGDFASPHDLCHACEKVACVDCSSSFFDCEFCDRLLCGDCVSNIPCEGSGCELSNCMECAENGDGDVLYCTNCGNGFCTGCKSMEFCFCLVGDTCPECHSEMHNHDVECYSQHLPSKVKETIADFATGISKQKTLDFWQECIQFLPPDKDFDIHLYRKTRQTRAASLILASDQLLKGKDIEAIYLLLYASLLEEVWNRGASFVRKAFDFDPKSPDNLICFKSFHSVIENSTTKANVIAHLHNQLSSIHDKEGKELFKCMDFALGKMQKSNTPIHSLVQQISVPIEIAVTISNMDSGRKEKIAVYIDTTLGWWLKHYVIKRSYQNWLRNPEMPLPNKSTKYFRVVHGGRTIFLSSAGKKTLQELDVKDGDEIVVGGVESDENDTHGHESKSTTKKGANKSKKSKKSNGRTKKKKSKPHHVPSLTEEQLMEKYRQEHSRTMTPVFEELGPSLKDIRNRINDLSIKKSAPKVRRPKNARKKSQPEPIALTLPAEDCLGGKAGKIAYPILVGEVTNLYKTSKSLARAPISIDLHGYSRNEALVKLDESLSVWVDTAMKGEYPWVIPVDIICGGGSQILSEVAQKWIRTKSQVANRPKGIFS